MTTKCDKYWWHLNKNYIIVLLCSIPFSLIFPVLSLIIPAIILFNICDKFLVFHNIGNTQDDSMRLILSMPFSRTQIFYTYIKGLVYTSLGYALLISLIRLFLSITNLSYVFFWSDNITKIYDFITYIQIQTIYLLFVNLLLIILINKYTLELVSTYLIVLIFALLTLSAFSYMKLGISEKTVTLSLNIIYITAIIVLMNRIYSNTKKSYKKFTEGESR